MDKDLVQQKISELRQKINLWNQQYFDLDKPSVSDQVYDAAYLELEELENKYPNIAALDPQISPIKILGSNLDVRFVKHQHQVPMLSLNKAYNNSDLEHFANNILKDFEEVSFFCEPKIDGLSIALHYDQGQLKLALTRGNGIEGEDVTQNVLQIKSIPHSIAYSAPLEIRGEIFLEKTEFRRINKALKANNLQKSTSRISYANPRNLAAGTIRQLDSRVVAQRNLSAFFYSIIEPEKHQIQYYADAISFLKKHNFPTSPHGKLLSSINDVYDYILELEKIKDQWEYETDGMVVKVNEFNYYQKLGTTAKFPHSAIAYKFQSEIVETKLLNIFPTVGRTGIITYNAALEPVILSGSLVSAATLHNYNYIADLKISINDIVKVKKAGDIIPKVLGSLNPQEQTNYVKILSCPSCDSILVESETKIDQFCINPDCSEVNLKKLIYFVSKDGINVVGLSEKRIRLLYEKGLVKNFADIFYLKQHRDKLIGKVNDYYIEKKILYQKYQEEIMHLDLEASNTFIEQKLSELTLKQRRQLGQEQKQQSQATFQEKSFQNLIQAIEKAKNIFLYQLISALGIKEIGIKNAKIIATQLPTLDHYLNFDFEEFASQNNFGPKMIENLKTYFADPKNIAIWKELQKIDWNFKKPKISASNTTLKLANLIFVITGKFTTSRKEMQDKLEALGATLTNSVTKNTNYLIANNPDGIKFRKAQELGIKIIDETEYEKLIK